MSVQKKALTTAFLRQALLDAPRSVEFHLSPLEVKQRLAAWLDEELAVVDSLELAKELQELCPVAGATTEDYVPRVVTGPTGARAAVRIMFSGGDPESSFVQIVVADRPIHNVEELTRLAALARESFARLRPRRVRIWVPTGAAWEPGADHPKGGQGKRLLAAPLKDLLSRATPTQVRVDRVSADRVYARYSSEYQAYLRSYPRASEWIAPENLQSLRDCEAQAGLFGLMTGKEVGGLVALGRRSSPWFAGWYVVESVLFDGFRGRGLAVPMHQAAYAQLVCEPGDFIWGTIDPKNVASIATALALGRADLGGDWWIG